MIDMTMPDLKYLADARKDPFTSRKWHLIKSDSWMLAKFATWLQQRAGSELIMGLVEIAIAWRQRSGSGASYYHQVELG